jgi:hypothetical protein
MVRFLDIEKILVSAGAIKVSDRRLRQESEGDDNGQGRSQIRTGGRKAKVVDDDDDDWD